MLKIKSTKFVKYLLVLIDVVEKNGVSGSKYKSLRKIENKILKFLAKLKD